MRAPGDAYESVTVPVERVTRSAAYTSSHLPALDGWRGIAVAAVVLFHAELLPGGWLGVDLFFVLSGFLITRLLVAEHRGQGAVSMGRFWGRRARRLLPALVLFFAGVALYAMWYPDKRNLPANLASEMGAAAAYVANWFQLSNSAGYWDTYVVASPLKHMWSLAIEEQFYILFPVVMVLVLQFARRSSARVLAVLCGGAIASWVAGVLLLASGAGFERVYLGTDTRVGAVLAGAAAGYASVTPSVRGPLVRISRRLAPVAAVGVLVALVVLDGSTGWSATKWLLMPAFELSACVLLVHATDQTSRGGAVHRTATLPPLLWLGTISYGLYLWHFPVLLAAERALGDWPRWLVVTSAVTVSLVIAQVSATLVEQPLRRANLGGGTWLGLGLLAIGVVGASMFSLHQSSAEARAYREDRDARPAVVTDIVDASDGAPPVRPGVSEPTTPTTQPGAPTTQVVPVAQPSLPLPPPDGRSARVLLLGDSMVLDLSDGFQSVASDRGVTASTSSMIGCSAGGMDLLPDSTGLGSPENVERCDAWRASWPDLAATASPDVALIVRVSSRSATPELVGSDDRCSDEYLNWYGDQLRSEVAALTQHVGVVAYTSPVYARFASVVDDTYDRATECVAAATERVADELDNVVYLPLGEQVCPTRDSCVTEADGVTLRPDGMHFQDEGALWASAWLLRQLYG